MGEGGEGDRVGSRDRRVGVGVSGPGELLPRDDIDNGGGLLPSRGDAAPPLIRKSLRGVRGWGPPMSRVLSPPDSDLRARSRGGEPSAATLEVELLGSANGWV